MEFDLKKPYCFYFNEICKIPHGSGNEKALSDWLVAFAKDQGLDWVQDEFLNVVIYKSASPGWEDHPTVVIQAHMDMVCEKVPESTHDFENEPLELYVEGDHLRARGTTLGADDGMGCAYMPVSYTHLDVYKRQLPPSMEAPIIFLHTHFRNSV